MSETFGINFSILKGEQLKSRLGEAIQLNNQFKLAHHMDNIFGKNRPQAVAAEKPVDANDGKLEKLVRYVIETNAVLNTQVISLTK